MIWKPRPTALLSYIYAVARYINIAKHFLLICYAYVAPLLRFGNIFSYRYIDRIIDVLAILKMGSAIIKFLLFVIIFMLSAYIMAEIYFGTIYKPL